MSSSDSASTYFFSSVTVLAATIIHQCGVRVWLAFGLHFEFQSDDAFEGTTQSMHNRSDILTPNATAHTHTQTLTISSMRMHPYLSLMEREARARSQLTAAKRQTPTFNLLQSDLFQLAICLRKMCIASASSERMGRLRKVIWRFLMAPSVTLNLIFPTQWFSTLQFVR